MKSQFRRVADEACKVWWEAKTEEPEKVREAAVRHGRGKSLLRDLKLIELRKKLRASTALLTSDGRLMLTSTAAKLERWRDILMRSGISPQKWLKMYLTPFQKGGPKELMVVMVMRACPVSRVKIRSGLQSSC